MKSIFSASPKSMLHHEFFVIALTNAFAFSVPRIPLPSVPSLTVTVTVTVTVFPRHLPPPALRRMYLMHLDCSSAIEMTQCIRDGNETEPKMENMHMEIVAKIFMCILMQGGTLLPIEIEK